MLNLDFSILVEEFGDVRVSDQLLHFAAFWITRPSFQAVELLPNGTSIPVTNANRLQYVQLVAEYYLNNQVR